VAYYTGIGSRRSRRGPTPLSRGAPARVYGAGVYVRLECLPLTPNGKLVGRPCGAGPGRRMGGVSMKPARRSGADAGTIWAAVLRVEQVGRHDDFFRAGRALVAGDSGAGADARAGLQGDIARCLIRPVLAELATVVGRGNDLVDVPANRIEVAATRHPGLLPLINADAGRDDRVVVSVPGGSSNVQESIRWRRCRKGCCFIM